MLANFIACLQMPRTTAADKNKSSTGGLPTATAPVPATPAPVPATSTRTVASGAAPAASSRSHSLAAPSDFATTNPNEPLSASDYVAQFNGTGDPLLLYTPEGGFTNDDSILKAIDLIEEAPANSYISDAKIARITDKGILMSIHFQRLRVFQLVVNLVDASQAIVGISPAITAVKENYERLMNSSLEALFKLNGGTMDLGINASRESRHQELKHCKIVEVHKFDVNKNSIINLNSPRENKRRIPVKERLEQPNIYASKLKGPAPEQSAKPREPLRFVKRNNNKVKR